MINPQLDIRGWYVSQLVDGPFFTLRSKFSQIVSWRYHIGIRPAATVRATHCQYRRTFSIVRACLAGLTLDSDMGLNVR